MVSRHRGIHIAVAQYGGADPARRKSQAARQGWPRSHEQAGTPTRTGRLWTYVRDERPHGGDRPSAALFFYSPDRKGERPVAHLKAFTSILHADGYAGFNRPAH
jgi:hypothetical protein